VCSCHAPETRCGGKQVSNKDILSDFQKAMEEAGITPPNSLLADGELHRFYVEGDKHGSSNGWYILHQGKVPAGTFGCWKRDISETWCARNTGDLAPEELRTHRVRMETARQQREAAQRERQREARETSQAIWESASQQVDADHPYLAAKAVTAFGLRQLRGQLLVPIRDGDGTLCSLQTITKEGSKRYRSGGKKQGCCHIIGKPRERLYVCEGYATGASIHQASGEAVAVAFDASNLKPVAESLRAKYPTLELIIAADNDHSTDGNPGLRNATEAATTVGALLAFPDLSGDEGTDFNDLATLRGLEAVRKTLEGAQHPGENEHSAEQGHNRSEDETEIVRLSTLSDLEYARQRNAAAKTLGVGVSSLDKMVRKLKATEKYSESTADAWEVRDGIAPWDEEVDGRQLAAAILGTFRRYCILPTGGDIALTLWTLGTYCYNAFSIFPKLLFSSPEKRCGKSTTMDALASLAHRALPTSNTSAAAIFRAVEEWAPSLLIDEADTFLNSKDNSDMVGIINSGHRKSMAYVLRVVGDDHRPKRFSTWAPMAIAMIKSPRDTIKDRSITLTLRRKLASEKVQRLPADLLEQSLPIRRQCLRWATDHLKVLSSASTNVPEIGNDRAEDNWLPLLAIADSLGGDWPLQARHAMSQLESRQDESQDPGTMLLGDIHTAFEDAGVDRLFTQELITALADMEDRPWCEWRGGKPITTPSLSKLLKPYDIKPRQFRRGYDNKRGYQLADFADAFARYLPPALTQSVTPLQATDDGISGVSTGNVIPHQTTEDVTPKATRARLCNGVTPFKRSARERAGDQADNTSPTEELIL